MNLKYLAVTFDMKDFDYDIWQALLGEWPFESFHEESAQITGYIQDHDITESLKTFIEKNKGVFFDDYILAEVPDKNWNDVWESSFNPVAVDHFYLIRAAFHPDQAVKFRHVITISPKMAFGTGHHATTYMMLRAMAGINFLGEQVLDYGCGTGILSVAAALEGATLVVGLDIQPEAIENSEEHATMNGVEHVCKFHLGGLEVLENSLFDIILANINRNVILDSLGALKAHMHDQSLLLISGIMFDDVQTVTDALHLVNLKVVNTNEKDQWVQLTVIPA